MKKAIEKLITKDKTFLPSHSLTLKLVRNITNIINTSIPIDSIPP